MKGADWLILAAAAICLVILFLPRVSGSRLWRATVTPLASIIGSGFLVLGPILVHAFGAWAAAAMAALCLVAWCFGFVMRENIRHAEEAAHGENRFAAALALVSDAALAFAYVVSVAYYLNLFGAFAVAMTPFEGEFAARVATTAALAALLSIGWGGGFHALEKAELLTVGIKLAIIGALIVGLAIHVRGLAAGEGLVVAPVLLGPVEAITLGFGLIVTVQGFETSRYLGATYLPKTRIRSMRLAQALATLIYVVYVWLLSVGFHIPEGELSETEIIDLVGVASVVLPPLLLIAALAAQASAAIADAGGAGGLVSFLTRGRVDARWVYLGLVAFGIALTWAADVFSIIAYASRAFAAYYGLQSALACHFAWRRGARGRAAFFALMAALGAAAAVFGQSVEGD